jgi:4-hydroxybutyrate CoA-transferase
MRAQAKTAKAAVAGIRPRSRIYVEGGAAHPNMLVAALAEHAANAGPFEIVTSVLGQSPLYCNVRHQDDFHVISFRGSPQTRDAYARGQLDVVPAGLSRIPALLAGRLRPDVALVQVSKPDARGWCSLGVSVLYHRAAIDAAEVVIAEINPDMPRTFGDGDLHISQIDEFVEAAGPLAEFPSSEPGPAELAAASNAAKFVPDGATVQVGMGSFADAVLAKLQSRRDLRIHAGLLSDGVIGLVDAGAVARYPGAVTTGALAATAKAYQAVDRNPAYHLRRVEHTHDPQVLAGLRCFVAINSALEVDFSGQVNGDTLHGAPVSGAGGALDFAHAASSNRGLSIVALTCATRTTMQKRILPQLSRPTVVSVPRTEIDILATEHGAVDLRGATLRERERLIESVAGV